FEADRRGILMNSDRPWLSNQFLGGDENDIANWSETSVYARNIIDPSTGDVRAMVTGAPGGNACSIYGDRYLPQILGDANWPNDTYCRYDYTLAAANTAELERLSAFLTAEYDINSDLTFRAQALSA